MELAPALFGCDVHNTAHGLSIFSIKGTTNQLKLLYHVLINFNYITSVISICNRHTINPVTNLTTSTSSDMSTYISGLKVKHLSELSNRQGLQLISTYNGSGSCQVFSNQWSFSYNDHLFRFNYRFNKIEILP